MIAKTPWILLLVAAGCAAPAAARPTPVDVVIASPEEALRPEPAAPPPSEPAPQDPGAAARVAPEIPAREAWAATIEVSLPFAAAMRSARALRDRALGAPLPTYTGPMTREGHVAFVAKEGRAWFQAVHGLLDVASGAYARASRARDAGPREKIAAMSEAADLHVALANRLLVLGTLPRAWRTDPGSALTYEEVVHGPEQQWKAEGLRLAARCVDLARVEHVDDASVKRCDALRRGRQPRSASGECCADGDPLCSASPAWCRER
jgi:hypothetical protein